MFTTTLGRITLVAVMAATFGFGVLLVAVWSVEDALYYKPQLYAENFTVPEVSARALAVFDVHSGTEIAAKNAAEVLPIASITKLLTASIFYDETNLGATTSITWQDINTEGEAGRLHAYEVYTNRGLMYPLLLESSNDAAAVMLRVAPELQVKMQEYAASLGLVETVLDDTSGLSDKNVSTAHELSILLKALYEKEPHIFDITQLPLFIGKHTGWMNNSPFVHEEGYIGGKHGFTYAANRTAAVIFDETLPNGRIRTIGYILLGSDDLASDIALLRAEVQKSVRYE